MSNCLYISPQELEAYTALGISYHEITRDYLEKGMLRSPMAIKHKLDVRNNDSSDLYFKTQESESEQFEKEAILFDQVAVQNWLFQFDNSMNVETKMVSAQDAAIIHQNKGYVYNNESAFFTDGIVYFVEGMLTPESVVHEFCHPIIKSLPAEVRNKLYDDLMSDPELNGQEILNDVKSKYGSDSVISEEQLKEEVLVRALTKAVEPLGNTPKFKNWLDKLLFQIRQNLRKLFGRKVDVATLNANTTLKDLANMITKGDVLELQKDLITSSDVIEHFKNEAEFIDAFDKIESAEEGTVQKMIDDMYALSIKMQDQITTNPDLFPFADALLNEYRTGIVDEIRDMLSDNPNLDDKQVAQQLLKSDPASAEKIKERLKNLTASLYKSLEFLEVMNSELNSMDKLDSKDKIDRLIYYKNFVYSLVPHIQLFHTFSLGESTSNPVKKLAEDLSKSLIAAQKKIEEIQKEALENIVVETLSEPAKKAMDKFQKDLARKKGAPQSVIDRLYKDFHNMTEAEYKEYKDLKSKGRTKNPRYMLLHDMWLLGAEFDREKANAVLTGQSKDASWWNSMLESLSMNTDPAIATVYQYIQDLVVKYQAESLNFYTNFVMDVMPHVEKTGGKFQNRGALGRDMGFKDVTGRLNPNTGEVERVEEWTFLNEWKDYRYDEAVHKADINKAMTIYLETNSDVDKNAWLDAERAYQLWKNKYMNQRYDVSYYETMDIIMKDELGRKAKEEVDDLIEELNLLEEDNADGKNDTLVQNLLIQMAELYSTFDKLGNKKTGYALEKAERLSEYRKARSEFFIEDEILDKDYGTAFQREYSEYKMSLQDRGLDADTINNKMNEWLGRNTRVVLKNSVHTKRQALIDEKKELLKTLSEENQKIYDTTELEALINAESKIVNDGEVNQPNGNEATSEARKKVLEAHEELEKARMLRITRSGLTGEQAERFNELRYIYNSNGQKWEDQYDEVEYESLIKIKEAMSAKLGLNAAVMTRLTEIDNLLAEMSSFIPTDFYKATVSSFLNTPELEALVLEFAEENDFEYTTVGEVYNEFFVEFLNSEKGIKAMELNPMLMDWVDQNHYEKGNRIVPSNLWMTSISNEELDYKTKRLKDFEKTNLGLISTNVGLIKIDGQYRVPKSRFYVRNVKDKYVTKKIVGQTVQNNENVWLPKAESTNRYRNAKYDELKSNDPDKFSFMEDLKRIYLEGQSGADAQDKNYYAFPKVQKSRLENILTLNIFTYYRRLKEFWYGREDDVFEYKTAKNAFENDQDLLKTNVGTPVIGVVGPPNINDHSTDILKTIPEYIASINHKKAVKASNSFARMMQNLIQDTKIDERSSKDMLRELSRKSYNNNVSSNFRKQKKSTRKEVIDALVEREIDAIQLTGVGSNYKMLQKTLSAMTKRSSKINFNWNLPSGIINFGQIKLATMTHAIAGDEINPIDALKGEAWAFKTMMQLSKNIRRRDIKSLDEQLLNLFDPASGRTEEIIGDSLSRTLISDVLDGKVAQNARRWLELEGTLQNFGAMMSKVKVNVTDESGNVSQVPYIKAFELVDGRIQTKKGVESKYSVTYDAAGKIVLGDGVVAQQRHMQNVIMKWNGAFSKKDAALVSRYVAARQLMFLKKHVIPMASKQYSFSRTSTSNMSIVNILSGGFAKKRMNWTTGVAEYGHHISTFKTLTELFKTMGRSALYMTASELTSMVFVATQLVMGYILLPLLYGLFTPRWGDDAEDEDKVGQPSYLAMKNRSGYYEGMFTVDEDYYSFDVKGFALNHLSFITLKMKDEYNSVNWFLTPSGMKDFVSQGTSQSIGVMQTMKYYTDLAALLAGDKKSTPGTGSSGPYFFQQEGAENGNLIELLFKYQGWNGKIIDPTGTQEAYSSAKQTR